VDHTLSLGNDAEAPRRIVIGNIPFGGGSELRGYTVNADTDNVSVIDVSGDPIVLEGDPIALDSDDIDKTAQPRGLALLPDNTALYVTEYQSAELTKVDTVDNHVNDPLALDYTPHRIAIEPEGEKAYIANPEDAKVSIVILDNSNVSTVTVQNTPGSVAILVQD
jgi:DNA-binding beta-propeller fold protein YncE